MNQGGVLQNDGSPKTEAAAALTEVPHSMESTTSVTILGTLADHKPVTAKMLQKTTELHVAGLIENHLFSLATEWFRTRRNDEKHVAVSVHGGVGQKGVLGYNGAKIDMDFNITIT